MRRRDALIVPCLTMSLAEPGLAVAVSGCAARHLELQIEMSWVLRKGFGWSFQWAYIVF
jgi:hypothetical protein